MSEIEGPYHPFVQTREMLKILFGTTSIRKAVAKTERIIQRADRATLTEKMK